MIVKERKIPLVVREIDAILSRIPLFHPKRAWLEEDRKNYMAGYRGEQQIDYHLKDLEHEKYLIFADIRLVYNGAAFQIDTIILSPYYLLITESKNIRGTLTFEKDSTQMIRELDGQKQGFKNPIVQVAGHKMKLTKWLKKHKIPNIPIEDLVGIADRRTMINTTNDNKQIYKKLHYADMLVEKIKQFEAAFTQRILTPRQLQKIKNLLLKEHTPSEPSILKFHNIAPSEISKGIQCPHCEQFPMMRRIHKWYCKKCKSYSRLAHKQAIIDYFLIFSTTISNRQFREFLMIDSRDIAKKLLLRMNLPTSGSNKNRLYHRPREI